MAQAAPPLTAHWRGANHTSGPADGGARNAVVHAADHTAAAPPLLSRLLTTTGTMPSEKGSHELEFAPVSAAGAKGKTEQD